MRHGNDCGNLRLHVRVVLSGARAKATNVEHHIKLYRACSESLASFSKLRGRRAAPVGKADDGAHERLGATQELRGEAHFARTHAAALCATLPSQANARLGLCARQLRLQNAVVDGASNVSARVRWHRGREKGGREREKRQENKDHHELFEEIFLLPSSFPSSSL